MRKLQRFVLNDARMLSREEITSIEGSLDVHLEDNCEVTDIGKACVYYLGYDATGHLDLKVGVCAVEYKQEGIHILETPYCK